MVLFQAPQKLRYQFLTEILRYSYFALYSRKISENLLIAHMLSVSPLVIALSWLTSFIIILSPGSLTDNAKVLKQNMINYIQNLSVA